MGLSVRNYRGRVRVEDPFWILLLREQETQLRCRRAFFEMQNRHSEDLACVTRSARSAWIGIFELFTLLADVLPVVASFPATEIDAFETIF